jgi:dipeptidyl aminopeptidase/acylaminoacyl peptidase
VPSPPTWTGGVGIRGWSYGGALAAIAVIRRPDVFHAAVSGAAPHDQRLYDTHRRERFLGLPKQNPDGYDRSVLHHHRGRQPDQAAAADSRDC